MKNISNYCKELGLIRLLACIAILMYHIGLLKGGYLAVCTFFVMSGYLTSMSCFKKEKFSLGKFYLNKFLKIYLPLLVVVFISIVSVSFINSINWFNLKPETTSVLLGYNNFWQLNANLDYFARHMDSPFMHLWYIAIILQFNIIFPIIFKFFKMIGERIHKSFPCIALAFLSVIMTVYFYYSSLNGNIMITYYDTLTRIFSLIFGVFLGFAHNYYRPFVIKKFNNKKISRIFLSFYILILILLCIFVSSDSKYFGIAMILTTLISCRLIDYSVVTENNRLNIFDKIVKSLSNVSYEIYLVQYPVIFIMQYISFDEWIKCILIIIITIAISYFIHFCLNFRLKKVRMLRYIAVFFIMIISSYGIYQYVIAKDHTSEMKKLELQLVENEELMKAQQEEYAKKLKQEQEEWNNTLIDLDNYEKELPNLVSNLPVVGVGDSVMLGVLDLIHNKFPNGYFDAQKSRTAWVANEILRNLSVLGMLGEPVIMNLGANGDCDMVCKDAIMSTIGNRKLFWVNVPNYNGVNNSINVLASRYENVYVIDWYSISRGHPEYFIADGVHLTPIGAQVYVDMIYDSIYNVYLEEFEHKKNQIINQYEEEQNSKISFFGNELLLNVYNYLEADLLETEFIIDADMDYERIIEQIKVRKKDDTLNHKIFFVFDRQTDITTSQYAEILDLCKDNEVYIVNANKKLDFSSYRNVKVIDFYLEINKNDNYVMPDKVHLTKKGNEALRNIILENINRIE